MAGPTHAGVPRIPGRNSGFTLGVLAAICCTIPLLCIPLGGIGLAQSLRAKRVARRGEVGYGVVVAALILNALALTITIVLASLAAIRTFG